MIEHSFSENPIIQQVLHQREELIQRKLSEEQARELLPELNVLLTDLIKQHVSPPKVKVVEATHFTITNKSTDELFERFNERKIDLMLAIEIPTNNKPIVMNIYATNYPGPEKPNSQTNFKIDMTDLNETLITQGCNIFIQSKEVRRQHLDKLAPFGPTLEYPKFQRPALVNEVESYLLLLKWAKTQDNLRYIPSTLPQIIELDHSQLLGKIKPSRGK